MIYHLIRKFATPTEIFIPYQINVVPDFQLSVLTIRDLGNHTINGKIFATGNQDFLSTKILAGSCRSKLTAILKDQPPQLFHAHYLTDARFFHPLTKKFRVPKVCSCYGYDVSSFPQKFSLLSRRYLNTAFKEYDLILAMSDDMKSDLMKLQCPEEKIVVHYQGINTKVFGAIKRDVKKPGTPFSLLTIASLFPFKGHMTVLRALKQLKEKRPDLKFRYVIVGAGPEKERLHEYAGANSLSADVSFEGLVRHGEKLLNYLQDADIFLHPSVVAPNGAKEGVPGTIVEAMSSGLPVISTYHAGIPSVIKDGETGMLIQEHDHDALVDRIIKLMENEELRAGLGARAKAYASQHLDLTAKGIELTGIYKSLINR